MSVEGTVYLCSKYILYIYTVHVTTHTYCVSSIVYHTYVYVRICVYIFTHTCILHLCTLCTACVHVSSRWSRRPVVCGSLACVGVTVFFCVMSVPLGCHGKGQRGIETEEGRACCQVRTDRDGRCGFTFSLAVSSLCLMLFVVPSCLSTPTLPSVPTLLITSISFCHVPSPLSPYLPLPHPLLSLTRSPFALALSHPHSSLPPTLTPLTLIVPPNPQRTRAC